MSPTAQNRLKLALFVCVAAAGLTGCSGPTGAGRTPLYEASPVMAEAPLGVFDRTAVLIAYYGSTFNEAEIAALVRQRDEAAARGDTTRVKELEAQGAAHQEHAHQQLAGRAPLDNISKALRDELPALAQQAGVSRIVPSDARPVGAPTVEVTDRIVALLPPARSAGAKP
jgi:hypothetical protein